MIRYLLTLKAIIEINLKSAINRPGLSSVAMLGVAVVVAVFISILSMAEGFEKTVASTGNDNIALIMRSGSQAELNSSLTQEQINIVSDGLEILDNNGVKKVSAELYIIVDAARKNTKESMNLPMRGITIEGIELHDNFKLTQGRMFTPGKNELIIGQGVTSIYDGMAVGRTVRFGKTEWDIVGTFSVNGNVTESEVWGDAKTIQNLFNRGSSFSSLRVLLNTPAELDAIKTRLDKDPRINASVITEKKYYSQQAKSISEFIRILGYPLAFIMAIGALAGAINTMYAAIRARQREIATLRTIGFSNSATLLGSLLESLILVSIGSLLGVISAYLLFNGYTVSTLSNQTFSQVVFAFDVTADIAMQGVVMGVVIGFFGGFSPAFKASRLPLRIALTND